MQAEYCAHVRALFRREADPDNMDEPRDKIDRGHRPALRPVCWRCTWPERHAEVGHFMIDMNTPACRLGSKTAFRTPSMS
jgi:hypothetical protein